ncbi:phage tail tape measure protein [Sphingomonas sp. MMS24-J13]|uniref:phage tail tape measure protein n=1 Tax=Sphingomonas sp. MMS24-J13 TaxID=3238686 RepID=UPI00384BE67A
MASSIIGQLRVILGLDTAQFEKGLDDSQKMMLKAGRSYEQIGQRIQNVGKSLSVGLTLPLVAIGGAALKMAADFETGMNRVQAASGASASQMKALRDQAAAFGRDKSLTATAAQAAEVMENLAKNGRSTEEILNGAAEATLKLSAATGGDFAKSADLATDIMTQFGKKAEDLPELVNKMSGAMIASKLDFENYALAIGQAGSVAGNTMPFEDFNAAIASTAGAFSSGSDAGTSFKTFLQRLVPQSKEAKEMMKALGLDFYDAQGRFVGISNAADQLKKHLGGLAQEAQSKALTQIFGTDSSRTAIALMNQGSAGIAKFRDEIDKVSASTQAAALMQGWSGAITQVKKSFEAASIAIGDTGFLKGMTAVLVAIGDAIGAFARLPGPMLAVIGAMAALAASVGPVLFVTGKLIGFYGSMLQLGPRLAASFAAIAAGEVAAGVAGEGAAIGVGALLTTLAPWAAVIGGIAVAIGLWASSTSKVTGEAKALASVTDTVTKAQASYQQILKTDPTNGMAKDAKELAAARQRQADQTWAAARAENAYQQAAAQKSLADAQAGRRQTGTGRQGPIYSTLSTSRIGGTGETEQSLAIGIAQESLAKAKAAAAQIDENYAKAKKAISTAPLPPKPGAGANPKLDFSEPKKFKESPTDKRADLRMQAEITAAQERGDEQTAQRLQDQLRLREQITEYQKTGLSRDAAAAAANRDMNDIIAARAVARGRELAEHQASLDIDHAQTMGNAAIEQSLRDQQQIRASILYYQQQGLTLDAATKKAQADQLQIDRDRDAIRQRWVEQDARTREIDLAKARGDSEESIRKLEAADKAQARAREIEAARGLNYGEGNKQAAAEALQDEQARITGIWRSTLQDGARAALDGNLKDWVKNWWKDRIAKGMEDALNKLSDLLQKVFTQLAGGSSGSGGGLFSSIGSALGSIFGGGSSSKMVNVAGAGWGTDLSAIPSLDVSQLPHFATGGSFRVGGSSGIDQNTVKFRATKGEMVDIRKPGADTGGGGNVVNQTIQVQGGVDLATRSEVARMGDAVYAATMGAISDKKRRSS